MTTTRAPKANQWVVAVVAAVVTAIAGLTGETTWFKILAFSVAVVMLGIAVWRFRREWKWNVDQRDKRPSH